MIIIIQLTRHVLYQNNVKSPTIGSLENNSHDVIKNTISEIPFVKIHSEMLTKVGVLFNFQKNQKDVFAILLM